VYVPKPVTFTTSPKLVWVARNGGEEPLNLALPGPVGSVRVSPDGSRIAFAGNSEVFISDTSRPSWSPIVSTKGHWYPVWSRDSRHVLVTAEPGSLVRVRADGTGVEQVAEMNDLAGLQFSGNPGAWTRDGRRVVFTYGNGIEPHLGILDLTGVGKTDRPWQPIDRPYDMSVSSLSPDDHWIVYQSEYSGEFHVYIDRFPAIGDPKPLSGEGGGSHPVWSPDGREVFYERLDGAMMAVKVETTPTFRIGNPELLFESKGYRPGTAPSGGSRNWDVAPNSRFLMQKWSAPVSSESPRIVVVQNWVEELRRKVN
jgi:Tol biopolymer transport system component